ncbi:MAG: carbon storage regulator CsrA [Lachnospiraceae bacterium]|jgi:carbon storage regulator|nr:carbon storage regulator CsrA [Lachnospiraceae bacterium]
MLALSRKTGESIIVGSDIELTVLEIKGDQVKIGINAPKQIPIYRKEIYIQIQEANQEAARQTASPEELSKLIGK